MDRILEHRRAAEEYRHASAGDRVGNRLPIDGIADRLQAEHGPHLERDEARPIEIPANQVLRLRCPASLRNLSPYSYVAMTEVAMKLARIVRFAVTAQGGPLPSFNILAQCTLLG
eukprot:CAMPEP_0117511484 /NCGR_PEP_ID=MMETSP0784-20121206/28534_1 /TAXON_ID=39447 /ORGANISM="" /LENGTH=114 /DNA_ID=CAMNT_0005307163 /DNA_START=133 /DNA_END=478 /DNA_ORIENTATION=+